MSNIEMFFLNLILFPRILHYCYRNIWIIFNIKNAISFCFTSFSMNFNEIMTLRFFYLFTLLLNKKYKNIIKLNIFQLKILLRMFLNTKKLFEITLKS